jgi:hypothetical protein
MKALIAKQLDPPYKPEMKEDLAYFDQKLVEGANLAMSILPQANQLKISSNKEAFDNFTSTNK